jgi:TPR repeat protein
MKKFISLLALVFVTNVFAQTAKQWDDPYLKADAPGYEEIMKAGAYHFSSDKVQFIYWIEKAADKGNLYARNFYAEYLLSGIKDVLKADTAKAIKEFFALAMKGYAPALFHAAEISFNDSLGFKSNSSGSYYLINSANQGYLPAKRSLAHRSLLGGLGVPRDIKKGIQLAEECANAGDIHSQRLLSSWYLGESDYQNAFKWTSMAVDNGDWYSMNSLAYMYAKGQGTEINFEKAHKLLNDANSYAAQSGELTSYIEANLLDSHGEIYLMEGKNEEANATWNQMKSKYPDFVEENKFVANDVFVRTMYEKEQKASVPNLASAENKGNDEPSIISDVDLNLPENPTAKDPVFAVIIANEKYNEVENVPYAVHDGETFMNYCEKTLGIPHSNIKFVADATLNNIKRQLSWLGQVMDVYQGEASIIFYYAGHGIPNESNGSAYLLPVDGYGTDVTTGYSLDKLYEELSSKPAKSVVVLLDACFSGAKRDGGMLASARGVAIKAKQNAPKGNMVVLSAAQGDETAYPYKEKGHGMFTYYLLKKLQETQGNVSFGELADYVTNEVKKQSIIINGKMQTPLVSPSGNATDWQSWKLR